MTNGKQERVTDEIRRFKALEAVRRDNRASKVRLENLMELSFDDFVEKYGLLEKDFADRSFTLKLSKYTCLYVSHYDSNLFTAPYAHELIDSVYSFSTNLVKREIYQSNKEILDDLESVQAVIKDKTAERASQKTVEAKLKKEDPADENKRGK